MDEIKAYTLYIVPTPIGNLNDITLRALNILKAVDIIACEDTRQTLKLLNHYQIKKRLIAYHDHNEKNSARGITQLIQSGKSVALVSDSGTPCISDPGYVLVNECLKQDLNIISLPGPCAFLPLLTASGLPSASFYFHGFLSVKAGRRKKQLQEMLDLYTTHIIYESPHRLLKLLKAIDEIFSKNVICIGKEITKINEKIVRGTAQSLLDLFEQEKIAGEFVILIANNKKKEYNC